MLCTYKQTLGTGVEQTASVVCVFGVSISKAVFCSSTKIRAFYRNWRNSTCVFFRNYCYLVPENTEMSQISVFCKVEGTEQ